MEGETGKIPWRLGESFLVLLGLIIAGYGSGILISLYGTSLPLSYRYLLVSIAQAVAVFGLLHYFLRIKRGLGFEVLGFSFNDLERVVNWGVGGGLFLFTSVILIGGIIQSFLPDPAPQPFTDLIVKAKHPKDLIIPFLIGVVIAPLTEEVYFRGFLFPALKKRFGLLVGITGSSIFFSLLHFDLLRFIPLAIGGIGLAYLYNKTGNILTSIIAHATWNSIMLLLLVHFSLKWF
ncbi:MAG: protease family protein [Clostridia bacterium]|nr:protease family protein [Clostridia bacterium]